MRRRILLLVVGMTTLVVLAFAIPLIVLIRSNAYNDGMSGLRGEASAIARFLREVNVSRTENEITTELTQLDHSRSASVELPGGNVLGPLVAGSAPFPTLPPGPGGNDLRPQAYRGGQLVQLRVPTFASFGQGGQPGGGDSGAPNSGSGSNDPNSADLYTVRVYADDGTLRSGQTGPLLLVAGIALALLVVGVVAGEILTRRIVAPLVDTAGTAQRLSAGDTTARAPTTGPREVADVGLALNRLADRIDQLIAEERETVADLSHRLRTPMTALRLDAEALNDHAEAERIGGHVTNLERMLTAVIRAARRPQREGRIPSCEATAVVGGRVEFWSALAEDQGRAMTVSLPATPVQVRAGEEDLAAAVDALLENVIAHTPEGTAFGVRLAATDDGAVLTVGDDGPGLPADAGVRGRSDRGSTGLGLDIARRCAESSGGSMTLGATAAGGALVTLTLRSP